MLVGIDEDRGVGRGVGGGIGSWEQKQTHRALRIDGATAEQGSHAGIHEVVNWDWDRILHGSDDDGI
jgi:hypothetical protein